MVGNLVVCAREQEKAARLTAANQEAAVAEAAEAKEAEAEAMAVAAEAEAAKAVAKEGSEGSGGEDEGSDGSGGSGGIGEFIVGEGIKGLVASANVVTRTLLPQHRHYSHRTRIHRTHLFLFVVDYSPFHQMEVNQQILPTGLCDCVLCVRHVFVCMVVFVSRFFDTFLRCWPFLLPAFWVGSFCFSSYEFQFGVGRGGVVFLSEGKRS